jgi:hypothetical protein
MEGGIMLKWISVTVVAVGVTTLLIAGVNHGGAAHAASAGSEHVTNYIPPTGPEMTAEQVQSIAVSAARGAGETGEIHLSQAKSNFAHAHALLMGEKPSAADESGPSERAEEMRSSVWVSVMTTADGTAFTPNVPTPRGHVGPSGQVMAIVTDAHTGFIKERYLGSAAPDVSLLGQKLSVTIPAAATGTAATGSGARAATTVRHNPTLGFIEGRLIPARVGRLVTLRDTHGHVVDSTKSLAPGAETRAGSFILRVSEGHYVISAFRCGRRSLHIRARHTLTVTLHCSS